MSKIIKLKGYDRLVSNKLYLVNSIVSVEQFGDATKIKFSDDDFVNVEESADVVKTDLNSEKQEILLTTYYTTIEPEFEFF